MTSTATTNSLVAVFLVGGYDGLSGIFARMKESDTGLITPWSAKLVNTAIANLKRSPTLKAGNSFTLNSVI